MKLASKEAIGLMLDGEVLVNPEGKSAWLSNNGFIVSWISSTKIPITDSWQSDGWELKSKQYNPIPKEWTNEWANWRAVDKSGCLYEFTDRPKLFPGRWHSPFKTGQISGGHDPTNWGNSLEARPKNTDYKISVKVDIGESAWQDLHEWGMGFIPPHIHQEKIKFEEEKLQSRIERIEKALGL